MDNVLDTTHELEVRLSLLGELVACFPMLRCFLLGILLRDILCHVFGRVQFGCLLEPQH